MSFDGGVPLGNYGGFRYDQWYQHLNRLQGSATMTEFNPVFHAPRQGVVGYTDDWSVEFHRLQMAYIRSRLSLSDQEQQVPKAQFQDPQAAMATLSLYPLPIADSISPTELHSGTPIYPELNCSHNSLTSRPDELNQDVAQVEPSIAHPEVWKKGSPVNAEGPPGSISGTETPNGIKKHNPDYVPLYSPGACDPATVISELESMENGLRAETARRISQVEESRIK
ncbi:hypothetical protein GGR55DRAFT_680495 [Xylaria sp. FL0064]|nr:hypothetical protein GGR55DRAFT_680495 [Xylaria sp. FL0064]